MKKILLVLLVTASLVACKNDDKKVTNGPTEVKEVGDTSLTNPKEKAIADTANYTTIEWLDPIVKDLGKIHKDRTIEITYRFKNSGTKNLVIENVTAQCGCTIPEKPEGAFAPGEEGLIKAKYNGSGSGTITKQVYVVANTNPKKDHTLTFNGEIIE